MTRADVERVFPASIEFSDGTTLQRILVEDRADPRCILIDYASDDRQHSAHFYVLPETIPWSPERLREEIARAERLDRGQMTRAEAYATISVLGRSRPGAGSVP